jgi:hypothetical protein
MYNLLNGIGKKEKCSHIYSKTFHTNAPRIGYGNTTHWKLLISKTKVPT